ncbi:MAG: 2-phosphosulfolactate phosphatase [Candidatus Eremiobacter antarcticus]|nr:2-phosphosulfolactate phosphatase [Candidatus Eremiobacteraeota bacterium]MBC5807657.1 2-phosphosulfolactate phosphatase [Candidatus Eremiobacteraeota bacterium]
MLHADAVAEADLRESSAVVVDVLRATTTIAVALQNGAVGVVPTVAVEDALALAQCGDRLRLVLGGERENRPLPGFDAGNSPSAYTAALVADKQVVLTTTNGTRALCAVAAKVNGSHRVYCGAFVNAGAVANALDEGPSMKAAVVCAGADAQMCIEDLLCAGMIAAKLRGYAGGSLRCSDGMLVAIAAYEGCSRHLLSVVQACPHARLLSDQGFSADVVDCCRVDSCDVVPAFVEGIVRRL